MKEERSDGWKKGKTDGRKEDEGNTEDRGRKVKEEGRTEVIRRQRRKVGVEDVVLNPDAF